MVANARSCQQALADLRRARRRRRVADFDFMEALYRAYVAALFGGAALWWLALRVGGKEVGAATVGRVAVDGPQIAGAVVAVALAIGLRSGGRGGPLALEAADVRHVLLAPVGRRAALRGPARRQLRFGAAWGAGLGAVVGVLASRRLGGQWPAWAASGALAGASCVDAALGAAMAVSGWRLGRRVAGVLALGVLGWSAADVLVARSTSPMSWLGQVLLWPLRWRPGAFGGVAFAALLVVVGLVALGGTSVEASERRASLVGQLRFAVTMRDLRTVILLRRQLAQEGARRRPWARIGAGTGSLSGRSRTPVVGTSRATRTGARRAGRGGEHPAGPTYPGSRRGIALSALWHRGSQGLLRFPAARLARLALLGAAAGAAAEGAWQGTTPLVAAAGLALYVAGLDVAEPLAQSVDHAALLDGYPLARGAVLAGLFPASAVAMLVVGAAGVATAVGMAGGGTQALAVAAVIWVAASLCGLAGAIISTVQGPPPLFSDSDLMLPPEAIGAKVVLRTLWPPLVSTVGVLPVLAVRASSTDPVAAAVANAVPVLVLVVIVLVWVRNRERLHAAFDMALGRTAAGGRVPDGRGA